MATLEDLLIQAGFISPIQEPGGVFARVDQGVDYVSTKPVVAVGPGKITKISPRGSWVGGTGEAVYEHLDRPLTVNGHLYSDIYYAEQSPLVSQGQRVKAGDPVMAAGGNEIGFARGTVPAAKLVGGLGAGTKPTREGYDFLAFANAAPFLESSPRSGTILVKRGGGQIPRPGISDPLGGIVGGASTAVGDITHPARTLNRAASSVGDFLKEWVVRGALILLGSGLTLMGLYLIVRALGAPSVAVIDRATKVATRGVITPKAAPRRQGDAAITRGEPVTRTGPPERTTATDRARLRRNELERQRVKGERETALSQEYGDIPF